MSILRPLPVSLATTLSKAQARLTEAYIGSPAEEYAEGRGLGTATVRQVTEASSTERIDLSYGFGYVGPEGIDFPGFETWRNLLTIPNFNRRGQVVGIKGRSLDPEAEHRYLNVTGGSNYLFNLYATRFPSDTIVLTEGEIDTLTVIGHLGLQSVAVPGVTNWRPWHGRIFESYEHVVLIRDNDSAGSQLVGEVRAALPEVVVITPTHKDTNEDVLAGLGATLRARIDEALRGEED